MNKTLTPPLWTPPLCLSSFTRLTSAITLIVFPALGLAMPTVSGNTVSWPDDGWYQVQRTDTYETVCEGSVASVAGVSGGPCVTDSADYIVINHSTGERFENISATDANPVHNTEGRSVRLFDVDYASATGEQITNNAVAVSMPVFPSVIRGRSRCRDDRRTSPNRLSCSSRLGSRDGEYNLP